MTLQLFWKLSSSKTIQTLFMSEHLLKFMFIFQHIQRPLERLAHFSHYHIVTRTLTTLRMCPTPSLCSAKSMLLWNFCLEGSSVRLIVIDTKQLKVTAGDMVLCNEHRTLNMPYYEELQTDDLVFGPLTKFPVSILRKAPLSLHYHCCLLVDMDGSGRTQPVCKHFRRVALE